MAAKIDRPKASSRRGYGIIYRPMNAFWTTTIFETPEAARKHWDNFWRMPGFEKNRPVWRNYRVVRVRQSISYAGEADK